MSHMGFHHRRIRGLVLIAAFTVAGILAVQFGSPALAAVEVFRDDFDVDGPLTGPREPIGWDVPYQSPTISPFEASGGEALSTGYGNRSYANLQMPPPEAAGHDYEVEARFNIHSRPCNWGLSLVDARWPLGNPYPITQAWAHQAYIWWDPCGSGLKFSVGDSSIPINIREAGGSAPSSGSHTLRLAVYVDEDSVAAFYNDQFIAGYRSPTDSEFLEHAWIGFWADMVSTAGTGVDWVVVRCLDCPSAIDGHAVADCPAPNSPVEGVVVEVRDAASNDLMGTTTTGPDGYYTFTDLSAGSYDVSITVPSGYNQEVSHVPLTLEWGETSTVDFELECQEPPVVTVHLPDVAVDEGRIATNSGTASDPDGDPVALSTSVGTVINHGDGTWTWSYPAADGPAASQTVTISGDDGRGGMTAATFELTVQNVAPTVTWIDVPMDPFDISLQPVSVVAAFTDPAGAADAPYTCAFDYGDGSDPVAGAVMDTMCTGPGHTYASPGVYVVTVTVTDKDGGIGAAMATTYIVIYDPSAGFVTGGGWIQSPPGAYPADPNLEGRANFGFVSKYRRGQSVPDGNTEFHFQAGELNFHSTSYDWLVIAGSHAKYKGSGQINNAGDYGFMLTATDAGVPGGGVTDLFRIKIWEGNAEETVIYDNKIGEGDDGYAGTVLGGGQIKIHSGGAAKQGPAEPGEDPGVAAAVIIPTTYALLASIPNPFNPSTGIRFDLPEAVTVRLVVYDTMGRAVARLVDGELPAGEHRVTFDGSGLPSGRYFYRLEAGSYTATRSMTLTK